jgi:hypothetical protein
MAVRTELNVAIRRHVDPDNGPAERRTELTRRLAVKCGDPRW